MHEKIICKKSAGRKPATMLKYVFLLLLFTALMGNWVFGQVTITKPTNGTSICSFTAVGGSAPAYTTLGNIVITEGTTDDFKKNKTGTIVLSAPSGWQFKNGTGNISCNYADFVNPTGIGISVSTSTITLTWTTLKKGGDNGIDVITISGIQVQATSTSSAAGSITYSNYSKRTVNGLVLNTTTFADLALIATPSITGNPTNSIIAPGSNTSFSVTASNTPTSYTWEVSTDGGTNWSTVSNGGVYSSATTATLIITGASIGMNGYQYRASATNACGTSAPSAAASLSVTEMYLINDGATITTCSGAFYDSGGSGATYENDETFIKTFAPSTSGAKVKVHFNSFETESGYDYLYVYDGPTTGSPEVTGSPFSGSTIPVDIISTYASGELTFMFSSDYSFNYDGWEATISCYTPCSGLNTQASIGGYTNNTGNSITVNWTRGDGDGVIVVARPTASAAVDPVSGITYTANSAYGTAGTTTGSDNYVVYNGTGTSVNVTGLTNANYTFTVYEYITTCPCYKLPGSDSAVLVGYCIPSGGTLDGISGVVFNTINNINTSLNSYTNYTGSFSTTLSQGQSYNLSVFVNTGGNYTNNQKAWIDWNNDGFFNTTEGSSAGMGEEYTLGTATNVTDGISSLCPLSITVPAGSIVGSVRMRVSSAYNGYTTSCATGIDGEFEDYAVTIINPFTWTGATSTAWNIGANWLGNSVPTATSHVLIPDVTNDPQINISTAACNNMTIQSGAVVTVTANNALTVNGTLTNYNGINGLIIESTSTGTGSLIHNTDNTAMTIQRFVSGFDYTSGTLSNKKYHCVSVPLVPANNSLSGLFMGSYLYDYNPSTNAFIPWSAPTTTPMDETEGFMIFYPNSSGNTYAFAGEANNGSFSCNTAAATPGDSGFYLVPNPYPSAIDWNASSGWTKTNLNNTIWIWNSTSQNYAVWNGTVGINEGSPYIPVGQSFFVQSNGDSPELIMNNNARLHNNTAFFKNQIFMPSCLVLQAETHSGSDETMMYFDIAGTPAEKIIGFNGPPKLYCYSGFQKLSIQSLPELTLPCSVDVGFEMTSDSLVTISAKGMDGFDSDISIIFEDLLTGQLIDLRTHPVFTFTHQTSNPKNRFRVHFSNLTNNITFIEHSYKIYNTDQYIVLDIPSLVGKDAMIEILDLTGRLLWSREMTLGNGSLIPQPDVQGIVQVRVTGSTGIFTSRLMIQK